MGFLDLFLSFPEQVGFVFLPEVYLVLSILFISVSEVSYHKERGRLVFPIAALSLVGAFGHVLWVLLGNINEAVAVQQYVLNRYTALFKASVLFISLLHLFYGYLIQRSYSKKEGAEYYIFFLALVLSALIIVQSGGIILTLLGLVLYLASAWFLLFYNGNSPLKEYAARGFIVSGLSSLVIFTVFFLIFYQTFGVLTIEEAKVLIQSGQVDMSSWRTIFLYIFFLFSFVFLLGLFPMQFYFSDMIRGAPVKIMPFLVILGPVVAFSYGMRVSEFFFMPIFLQKDLEQSGATEWRAIILVCSFFGLFFSSFMALYSSRIKKIISYIILYQLAFFSVSFSILSERAFSATVMGLFSFAVCVYGVFYFLEKIIQKKPRGLSALEGFYGLYYRDKKNTLFLLFFVVSLIGLPPFSGFILRFILASELIALGYYEFILAAFCFEVVLVAGLARLVYVFTRPVLSNDVQVDRGDSVEREGDRSWSHIFFVLLLAVPPLVFLIFLSSILRWLGESFRFLLWS